MVMFTIAFPIAAIGCAIAGKYGYAIIFIILGSAGIGGYTYLLQHENELHQ